MTNKHWTIIIATASVVWLGACGEPALSRQVEIAQRDVRPTKDIAPTIAQRHFDTPTAAVDALVGALDQDDVDALLDIFGREDADLVLGTDPASGRIARQRAAALASERIVPRQDGNGRVVLTFGSQSWPFPIPLVRDKDGWMFDTADGIEEIQARRIGENELSAIENLRAFVQAQQNYAIRLRDEGKSVEYARYIQSTPGTTDGLWWPESSDTAATPSPLASYAMQNQEFLEERKPGDPFKGYYYRILRGQGRHAPGGTMSYMDDGRLARGFAIIAWPSDYQLSGVMSFMVDRAGRIWQKDLGEDTSSLAQTIRVFDPDTSWQVVDQLD